MKENHDLLLEINNIKAILVKQKKEEEAILTEISYYEEQKRKLGSSAVIIEGIDLLEGYRMLLRDLRKHNRIYREYLDSLYKKLPPSSSA